MLLRILKLNPNVATQPRGENGRWIRGGASVAGVPKKAPQKELFPEISASKKKAPTVESIRASLKYSNGELTPLGEVVERSNDLDFFPEKWMEACPNVAPEELLDLVSGGGWERQPDYASLGLSYGTIFTSFEGENKEGVEIFFEHSFSMRRKVVHHGYTVVKEDPYRSSRNHGKGTAKQFFRDALPIYDRMGMTSIELTAGLDAGPAVWGRFGFAPFNASSATRVAENVSEGLNSWGRRYLGDDSNYDPALKKAAWTEIRALDALKGSMRYDSYRGKFWALFDTPTTALDTILEMDHPYTKDKQKGKKGTWAMKYFFRELWGGDLDLTKGSPARNRLERYIQ